MSQPPAPELVHRGRSAWADVAKAVAIVLVVLHHTVGKHLGFVTPTPYLGIEAVWVELTNALEPVRMPLFFIVSGLFAGHALARPWRDVVRTRVVNVYYLYALWLVIHMAVFLVLDELPMNRTRDWTELATNLLVASTGLWYLYALVVYFIAARLLARVDARIVVGLAAVLALVTPSLGIEATNRASLLQHFFFFVFAARYPAVLHGMSRLQPRSVLLVAGAGAAVLTVPALLGLGTGPSRFMISLFAVPLAVRGCAALAQWRPAARLGSFLGRRTLPIYVLHVPVLAILHSLFADSLRFEGTSLVSVVTLAVYPLAATCVIVLTCLVVERVLDRAGFGWLFSAPLGQDSSPIPEQVAATPRPSAAPRRIMNDR